MARDGDDDTATALWQLIERRAEPGSDPAAIDREIWDRFGGDWAVMFTDLSGFSRRVAEFGIIHFLQVIHAQHRLLRPIVEHHAGRLVKAEADSLLVLFRDPAAAVTCAVAMQRACKAYSASRAPQDQLVLCLGLGFGRMLEIGHDVFGHEVNLASKLGEDTADGHEILATAALRDAVTAPPGATWEQLARDYAGETICWRLGYV